MKKILVVLLMLSIVISFIGCKGETDDKIVSDSVLQAAAGDSAVDTALGTDEIADNGVVPEAELTDEEVDALLAGEGDLSTEDLDALLADMDAEDAVAGIELDEFD
ncbi:MAG: hypothetical protein ABIG89_02030 [Candidatus Woesearchaeota archaeon]